jgi:hypothetical protein
MLTEIVDLSNLTQNWVIPDPGGGARDKNIDASTTPLSQFLTDKCQVTFTSQGRGDV